MTTANKSVPVYQYYSHALRDHEYTTRDTPYDHNWDKQGVAFYAFDSQVTGTVPVYQYFSGRLQDHEYTTRDTPYDHNWDEEGVAFYAFDSQVTGTVPVYQYFSGRLQDHEYTTRDTPYDHNWDKQGVAFYAFDSQVTGTVPVYQYFSSRFQDHEYTTRSTPYDDAWNQDDVAFYAYPEEDELVGFELHESGSKLSPGKPIMMGTTRQINKTSEAQDVMLSYTEQTTTTNSCTHQIGFKYSVKSKLEAGVLFTKADLELGLEFSHSHSWTDSQANTKGMTVNIMVKAAPRKTTVAKAICHQHDMTVPYTLRFKSGRRVEGVWKGVAHSKVTVEYKFTGS